MRIGKKRIHNLQQYLADLSAGEPYRVIARITPDRENLLSRAGFPANSEHGTTVLPAMIGPVSRHNAEGTWRILHDQPKESRYIRTVRWRWTQWAGRDQTKEMEEERDIFRDCYPRELVTPPAIELSVVECDGDRFITSPTIENDTASATRGKHVINLMLELFGTCETHTADLAKIADAPVNRVNWHMLPPGEYPWPRLEEHMKAALRRHSNDDFRILMDRQETIKSYGPDEIYVGSGGFSDYVAYRFTTLGIVVMESIQRDNALYVFGEDWERVSQLTKAEVLSNQFHRDRLIHAKGWRARLHAVLRPAAAA